MKKIVLLVVVLIIALSAFTQKKNVITSRWLKNPVIADGEIAEWVIKPPFYDSFTKINYEVANDSNNMYICFLVKDSKTQNQILNAGMRITLLMKKGRYRRKAYIDYPVLEKWDNKESVKLGLQVGQNPNLNALIQDFRNNCKTMETHGFSANNGIVPTKNDKGINVAIDWDLKKSMIYEIVIPLKSFFGDELNYQLAKEIIIFTLDINSYSPPDIEEGSPFDKSSSSTIKLGPKGKLVLRQPYGEFFSGNMCIEQRFKLVFL